MRKENGFQLGVGNFRRLTVVARDGEDLPRLIAVGVIGVGLYTLALNTGLQTVTAGAASFIVNTAPLFSTVFACVMLKERLGWPGWLGLFIGLAGLGLIATGEKESGVSPGALLLFASAVAWALYQIIQKPLLPYYGPLGVVCYAVWFGTVIFLPSRLAKAAVTASLYAVPPWKYTTLPILRPRTTRFR